MPGLVSKAAQTAFSNSAIVEAIVSNLRFELKDAQPDAARNKALLSLAMTHKACYEPSINSLWWCLDSVLPLLALIPILQVSEPYTNAVVSIDMTVPQETWWTRFNHYAPRVHVLHLLEEKNSIWTRSIPHILPVLAQLKPKGLLPRLRTLSILHLPENTLALPILCLSPTLSTIKLHTTSINTHLRNALLQVVAVKCPNMRSIWVDFSRHPGEENTEGISGQTFSLLSKSSFHVRVHNLRSLDLASLSRSHGLRTLGVYSASTDLFFGVDTALSASPKPFHSLRCLELKSAHPSVTHAIIERISSTQIEDIYLAIPAKSALFTAAATKKFKGAQKRPDPPATTPDGQLMHLMTTISSKWKGTLESFEINFTDLDSSLSPPPPLQAAGIWKSFFDPFAGMKSLQFLCFINFPYILPGHLDFTFIAHLLPNLRVLHLPEQEIGQNLSELQGLVLGCPKLEELAVSIDFRDWPSSRRVTSPTFFRHRLCSLIVRGKYSEQDPHAIAWNLDCLFPHLSRISGESALSQDGDLSGFWDGVEKLVHLCQDARWRTMGSK